MSEQLYYLWECPKCGKKIVSLYKEQFEQNKQVHELTHKNEEDKDGRNRTEKDEK